jgi:hypothetical protein
LFEREWRTVVRPEEPLFGLIEKPAPTPTCRPVMSQEALDAVEQDARYQRTLGPRGISAGELRREQHVGKCAALLFACSAHGSTHSSPPARRKSKPWTSIVRPRTTIVKRVPFNSIRTMENPRVRIFTDMRLPPALRRNAGHIVGGR